jgi:hypothetical protein
VDVHFAAHVPAHVRAYLTDLPARVAPIRLTPTVLKALAGLGVDSDAALQALPPKGFKAMRNVGPGAWRVVEAARRSLRGEEVPEPTPSHDKTVEDELLTIERCWRILAAMRPRARRRALIWLEDRMNQEAEDANRGLPGLMEDC